MWQVEVVMAGGVVYLAGRGGTHGPARTARSAARSDYRVEDDQGSHVTSAMTLRSAPHRSARRCDPRTAIHATRSATQHRRHHCLTKRLPPKHTLHILAG